MFERSMELPFGLIPTRFLWKYGGQQVLLSTFSTKHARLLVLSSTMLSQVSLVGSFTHWVEPVPMQPLDGSPGVFFVVVHLSFG